MRPLFSFVFAAFALALSGCDGDDPPHGSLPPPIPLPECPDADYNTCDIREAPCQERISALAACMRGNEPLPDLRIDVLSEAAFTTMLRAEATEPTAEQLHAEAAQSLFGLGPARAATTEEEVQNTANDIAGLYRDSDKRIIIVDHGRPADAVDSDVTLLHEFIHALQDADYDLANWPAPAQQSSTFDGVLAHRSLVEGEARFYEYRAAVPFLGLDITQVDFDSTMHEHLQHVLDHAFTSDAPLNASFLTFPYAYGALQAYAAWKSGGPRGTDTLWANPPATTQQVMAGVLAKDQPQASGVDIPTADVTTTHLNLESMDALGAWGLNLLLQQKSVSDAVDLSLAWRGDHFWVVTDTTSPTIYVLWEIELESMAAARRLNDIFTGSDPSSFGTVPSNRLEHATLGARVYVSGAYQGAPHPELTAAGQSWLSGD